jgi:hypothetical protein
MRHSAVSPATPLVSLDSEIESNVTIHRPEIRALKSMQHELSVRYGLRRFPVLATSFFVAAFG